MSQYSEYRRRLDLQSRYNWKIDQLLSGQKVDDTASNPQARMVCASAVVSERVEWLWPGRIPLGMLTLFSGDPKLGKSLVTLATIAAVTHGGPLPGHDADSPATVPRGSAILLSAEDDTSRTIVPRLTAAGADLQRVHILSHMVEPECQGDPLYSDVTVVHHERMPTLSADDLALIEQQAAALGDCRLIVFDPISAYLSSNEGRSGNALRRALAPLGRMAERLGAAVVLVTHHNKHGGSGTNGKYRVLGSIESVCTCRANFLFLPDPDDPSGQRVLMLDNGCNLAPGQPALAYVIRDRDGVPFCEWQPGTIDLDADAALARAVRPGESGPSGKVGRRRACEEWLRGYLAAGPKPATECEQAALSAGFTSSILHRARIALAIRCLRSGFGKGACYQWCLPEAATEPADGHE